MNYTASSGENFTCIVFEWTEYHDIFYGHLILPRIANLLLNFKLFRLLVKYSEWVNHGTVVNKKFKTKRKNTSQKHFLNFFVEATLPINKKIFNIWIRIFELRVWSCNNRQIYEIFFKLLKPMLFFNPFSPKKIKVLRFLPKFYHVIIAFHRF